MVSLQDFHKILSYFVPTRTFYVVKINFSDSFTQKMNIFNQNLDVSNIMSHFINIVNIRLNIRITPSFEGFLELKEFTFMLYFPKKFEFQSFPINF